MPALPPPQVDKSIQATAEDKRQTIENVLFLVWIL